ncbi:hypothetical protein ACIBQ3_34185 [Streptomyces rubiginosohelvolus]|uniref:hypothetical protein n=1 Tax=Streptomyces rubiginosohelvolus TaxID=67362 RepID=UPI0037AC7A64
MIVQFIGGPLAGLKLATTEDRWAGGWFSTEGAAEWTLYVPVHRDPVTGIVLAEARATAPVQPVDDRPGRAR